MWTHSVGVRPLGLKPSCQSQYTGARVYVGRSYVISQFIHVPIRQASHTNLRTKLEGRTVVGSGMERGPIDPKSQRDGVGP